MSTAFVVRLRKCLIEFNLQEAETLSDQLHAAEVAGVELSRVVQGLWQDLSTKIQEVRKPQ